MAAACLIDRAETDTSWRAGSCGGMGTAFSSGLQTVTVVLVHSHGVGGTGAYTPEVFLVEVPGIAGVHIRSSSFLVDVVTLEAIYSVLYGPLGQSRFS